MIHKINVIHKSRWAALFLLALFVVTTGCGKLRGSGIELREVRNVGGFERVSISGSTVLIVRIDPEEASGTIEISGDDDIVPTVKTRVADGVLEIVADGGKMTNLPLKITAVVADLRGVELSGAALFEAVDIDTEHFELQLSGAAKVTMSGRVNALKVSISGAASVDAAKLIARSAEVSVSGVGKVELHVEEALDVKLSGAGSVRYRGDPKKIEQSVSGAGSVKRVQ